MFNGVPQSPSTLNISSNGVPLTPSFSSSRGSYGSIGHDESFPPPPSPICMSKFQHPTEGEFQGHRHENDKVMCVRCGEG